MSNNTRFARGVNENMDKFDNIDILCRIYQTNNEQLTTKLAFRMGFDLPKILWPFSASFNKGLNRSSAALHFV